MTFKWYGEKVLRIVEQAALEGLRDGAEHILTVAIDRTPLDTGTLRRSGTVTVGGLPDAADVYKKAADKQEMKKAFKEPVGSEKTVYISFNTPYAVRQHEDLNLSHKDGQAKYLESAYLQEIGKVLQMVGRRIDRALR